MRAIPTLVLLAILLPTASASAVLVIDAPGICRPTTIDSEVCVGEAYGCTGVLFRAPRFDHFVCYGVCDCPSFRILLP